MSSLKRSNTMQTLKRSNTMQTIKRAGTGAWKWINAEDANISQNHPVGVSYFQRSNTYKKLQSSNSLRYRQQQRPAYNTQYQSYTNNSYDNAYNNTYDNNGYNNGYNNSYNNSYNNGYNNSYNNGYNNSYNNGNNGYNNSYNYPQNDNSYSVSMDNKPGPSASVKRPEPAAEKYEKENDMNKRKKNSKIPSVLYDPEVRKQLEQMKQHKPYFMYLATAIQIAIFVYSLYYNYNLTKSWVAPFNENPMIGPSSGTLINLGARFLPCMKETEYLYRPILCPTGMTGTFDPANPTHCSLKDMCGFDMKSGEKPNQWYRFIVPIFLHGGIIHIIFNLSFQIRTGIQMEKDFGTWRIMIIYLLSGIFGFAFEAKSNGVAPSVGCSGSLYGLMACLLLDLIQSWKLITNPWTELFKMILIIIFSLGIGLLPNIDNYAHIGGFMMGILTGLIFLPSIIYSKRHLKIKRILMIISVFLSIFLFIWVFRQFYYSDGYCSWCHYLNCLPINHWCDNLTASAADIATNNP